VQCESCSKLQKTLTKKEDRRPPEVNFGPFCDLLLPKTAGFLAEDSSDIFNSQLKWKYNWKFDQNSSQTTITITVQSVRSFRQFIVIVVIKRKRGVRYHTLSSPFFTVTYSKLAHGPKEKKRKEKHFRFVFAGRIWS
jgi:hypothetical protein